MCEQQDGLQQPARHAHTTRSAGESKDHTNAPHRPPWRGPPAPAPAAAGCRWSGPGLRAARRSSSPCPSTYGRLESQTQSTPVPPPVTLSHAKSFHQSLTISWFSTYHLHRGGGGGFLKLQTTEHAPHQQQKKEMMCSLACLTQYSFMLSDRSSTTQNQEHSTNSEFIQSMYHLFQIIYASGDAAFWNTADKNNLMSRT